jgi:hypothetical protein
MSAPGGPIYASSLHRRDRAWRARRRRPRVAARLVLAATALTALGAVLIAHFA